MTKLIRIDTVAGVKDGQLEAFQFGDEVVRFTFDDGQASYASVGAFPSKEVLVEHATMQGHFINNLLTDARGSFGGDNIVKKAESMNNWTPLWVDKTLRAV